MSISHDEAAAPSGGVWHLLNADADILGAVRAVHKRRSFIEQSACFKIGRTHDKLAEVSRTTMTAASDILDALDRAVGLLDALDECAEAGPELNERAGEVRSALRDELFATMGFMQFQDIASQQLATATHSLAEAEARLSAPEGAAKPTAPASADPMTFDPRATMFNGAERQAAVDEAQRAALTDAA